MRLFGRSIGTRGGAALLARSVAAQGQMNWPKCALCMRAVDAYGLENDTDEAIEVWAKCTGVRIDPTTGQAVHGAPKVHDLRKDSTIIRKGPGWSEQRLTDILHRMAFFDPEGDREFQQTLSPDGARVH